MLIQKKLYQIKIKIRLRTCKLFVTNFCKENILGDDVQQGRDKSLEYDTPGRDGIGKSNVIEVDDPVFICDTTYFVNDGNFFDRRPVQLCSGEQR